MRKTTWLFALFAMLAGLAAAPAASAQDRFMAGLGNNPGSPVGTPLSLPPGVRLLSIKGFDDPADCKETELGVGKEELCLSFCTEEDRSYVVHIPAGTMFKRLAGDILERMQREGKSFQNVILVRDLNVYIEGSWCSHLTLPPSDREEARRKKAQAAGQGTPLPAGSGRSSGGRFLVRGLCLNVEMDVPGEGAEYELGPVTSHPKLQQVLKAIKGKKTDSKQAVDLIQDAIWEVTDYQGLTPEMLARLRALPPA